MLNIGERIQMLRKQRGYNQDQLAEMASLNRVTIAKYESGRIEPGAQALARIADALDVSVDYLIGREDDTDEQSAPNEIPQTIEARIISGAVDRLPQVQRETILNMLRALLANHPELFEEVTK